LAELCRVLFDTQRKLMEVNNECVELRSELEEVKRRVG
jgi:vacuolar-type H+-ATPase subunit D/Vma8